MSKLRECTHRVIPICGAVLVTFSLGGGLGYAVNGKPLPRDAAVGVSIAFLVLGVMFGAGCLRLYICRRARHRRDAFDMKKTSDDADVSDFLERGQAQADSPKLAGEVSPPPPMHRTVGPLERARMERSTNQKGIVSDQRQQQQRQAAKRHHEPPETPTPGPRRTPYSWERPSEQVDPIRRKTAGVGLAHQDPPRSTQKGSEHRAAPGQAPPRRNDGPKDDNVPQNNVPKRTQTAKRRDTPHRRNDSAATIRAHNPYAAPATADVGRLTHDIVALAGMPKTQAGLRDGGEPVLPRSSSLKGTGSARKTGPGSIAQLPGPGPGVERSSSQRSHSQVSSALGVGPHEWRANPSRPPRPLQPPQHEQTYQAYHPSMSSTSVNHQSPSVEEDSTQEAGTIPKPQRPGQTLGRSLTARKVGRQQEDNVGTTQTGGWI